MAFTEPPHAPSFLQQLQRELAALAPDARTLLGTEVGRRKLLNKVNYLGWPLSRRLATACRHSLAHQRQVVAVVGSLGKTTTTRAIQAALGLTVPPTPPTNAWSGVALPLLLPWGGPALVLEVGIDRVGQMAPYATMLRPDAVVVTAIARDHHNRLGSLEATRAEKGRMVEALPTTGLAVLNGDDPHARWMADLTAARSLTYGFEAHNDVRAEDVTLDWPTGMRVALRLGHTQAVLTTQLLGRQMVYPLLAAVALACGLGLPLAPCLANLTALAPTPARLHPVLLPMGATYIRDDFKSHQDSWDPAIDLLAAITAPRRTLVMTAITELQGSAGPVYRALGRRIASAVSRVFFLGQSSLMSPLRAGLLRGGLAPHHIHRATDMAALIAALRDQVLPGEVLLGKATFHQRLERLPLALAGQEVRCDLDFCKVWHQSCADCTHLAHPWGGRKRL